MAQKGRYAVFLGVGVISAIGLWAFRDPLRSGIARRAALANPAPSSELIEEVIESAADRPGAILQAWESGKIIQREVAVREIGRTFQRDEALPPKLHSILLAAAMDPDMSVRESALSILEERRDSALPALAAAQLRDADPQVRLLGLNHLKQADAKFGVTRVMAVIDDGDPLLVGIALKLLEHWSGEKFGVKLSDTTPSEDPETGLQRFPEGSREAAKAGADRAKAWWAKHPTEFGPIPPERPPEANSQRRTFAAGDFALRDLDGRTVRLSDYRGKVVLINFWTTWCSACVSEIPELIALQKQHQGGLAILGVSLDFVPDSHGHIGGHAAAGEPSGSTESTEAHEHEAASLAKIREKVARTVKARGMNYSIFLDEKNEIGGRFNGGELPTTVIIDENGNIRRRFIGARSLAVFEAMIAEAKRGE